MNGKPMPLSMAKVKEISQMRADAEVQLREGTAPPTRGWSTSAQALTLLHRLASAPQTAGDAHKLLHELQVHQVELDLQQEQLEQAGREQAEQLERYAQLYELAPFGYFTVDLEYRIIQANLAGARLLGVGREALAGQRLDGFLADASQGALHTLLQQVQSAGASASCEAQTAAGAGGVRRLQMLVSAAPGGKACLVGLIDIGASAAAQPTP